MENMIGNVSEKEETIRMKRRSQKELSEQELSEKSEKQMSSHNRSTKCLVKADEQRQDLKSINVNSVYRVFDRQFGSIM